MKLAWSLAAAGTALVGAAALAVTRPWEPQAQRASSGPAPTATSEDRLTQVTQASIAAAIARARGEIARRPGLNYVVRLPAGTFDLTGLEGTTGGASIDLSRFDACPGRLTIAGTGMARTTIVTDDQLVGIRGQGASCITIADLTMTRRKLEVTQGTVVAATRDSVTLDIPAGFPLPPALMPAYREMGRDGREVTRRWLKKYVPSPTGPQIIVDQIQAKWVDATQVPGASNRWRFNLVVRGNMPDYRPGDLLGVKAKSGYDSYRFVGGHDITLRGVRWTVETRGTFKRVDNVTIQDCVIVRPPPINGVVFALASSTGGPQIGQPNDPMTKGHLVTGNDFQATGDDALLMAHADGVVRGNRFSDTFGNAIRIYESDVALSDNVLVRAPILRVKDDLLERRGPSDQRRPRPPSSDRNDRDDDDA